MPRSLYSLPAQLSTSMQQLTYSLVMRAARLSAMPQPSIGPRLSLITIRLRVRQ